MASKKRDLVKARSSPPVASSALLEDLRRMIEETRQGVAATVNAALTLLYWRMGKRINEEILQGKRAEYGEQILATVSQELTAEYGRGWSKKQLWHCLRFAETFPDEQIVSALRRQLSWTHLKTLIYLDDPLKRDFYAEVCRMGSQSTRTLEKERILTSLIAAEVGVALCRAKKLRGVVLALRHARITRSVPQGMTHQPKAWAQENIPLNPPSKGDFERLFISPFEGGLRGMLNTQAAPHTFLTARPCVQKGLTQSHKDTKGNVMNDLLRASAPLRYAEVGPRKLQPTIAANAAEILEA